MGGAISAPGSFSESQALDERTDIVHAMFEYLCQKLDEMLTKHTIVVLYDQRSEFLRFFDTELPVVDKPHRGLSRVQIREQLALLARYEGSFFGLRAVLEPIASLDSPERLIVYVPGVARDHNGSVLMELEKGGICYEPQLRRLARNLLRKRFTDGEIDELLRPPTVTYDDIVSFAEQDEKGKPPSILRSILGNKQSEGLLIRWLTECHHDAAIDDKGAGSELYKLIETRLGLALDQETNIQKAREKTLRYVLVNEFRSGLNGEPPSSMSMIPTAPGDDRLTQILEVAGNLRRSSPDRYIELADQVEKDLGLDEARVDAEDLSVIDTFRFEEKSLLTRAGQLLGSKDYDKALALITAGTQCFWVHRNITRQSQWEACRFMVELGREIERVRPLVVKMSNDPANWLSAYTAEDGWHKVDSLHRQLETWIAKMDEEPEGEAALNLVRREYEELLKVMAEGFAAAYRQTAWTIPDWLHQTRIYPDVVRQMGGRVAYFLVDALRFEMGVELAQRLHGAKELTVRSAVGTLPTITPIGMAALLPGASASFSVVAHRDRVAASIEGTPLSDLNDRRRFLKAKVPDAVDLTLGPLLKSPSSKLEKTIGQASLVVVRSQEIDFVGEMDGDLLARQVLDTIIANLARAVRKLAGAGIQNFVITADHGHQFSMRKEDDMRTDNPGDKSIHFDRRCWIGHGGSTPPGTVRVTGAELGYDTDLDLVFPTGLGVFKAGGGLSFHHGGFSLQELIIPVVTFRMQAGKTRKPTSKLLRLQGVPDKITNRTFGARVVVDQQELFPVDPIAMRVVLVSGGEEVGQAGMVMGGDFNRLTGILIVQPGTTASVGLMLTRDDCEKVRIVIQDPATDAVLDQSGDIPVKLGI